VEAFGRRSACADREGVFCVGGGRRLARRVPISIGLWRPSAGGWPAPTEGMVFASAEADAWRGGCRMNSACGGLQPAVGLRRPGGGLLRRRRPTPGARAPWKSDFNRRGGLRPVVGLRRPGGGLLRRRRPTPGAERLWRPISIGVEAFGRRLACADREGVFCVGGGRRLARSASEGRFQSAWRPSADDRPVPTEGAAFASAEADARRGAPIRARADRRFRYSGPDSQMVSVSC